jgi:hypothetical protein
MEVAGLQVIPLPPSFPLQIHRSALVSVKPSIAPSNIIDIKTTEFPLVLRAQGISGTSLSAWVLVEFFGVFGEMGVWGDRDIRASPNIISVLLICTFLM